MHSSISLIYASIDDIEPVPMWGPEIFEKYKTKRVAIKTYRGGIPSIGECVAFIPNNHDCWRTSAVYTNYDGTIIEIHPSYNHIVMVGLRR